MFRRRLRTGYPSISFDLALIALAFLASLPVVAQAQTPAKKIQLAETFDLLPSEFQMILAVPDLSTLSDRAAVINDQLDLQITGLTDLLNEFKRATGMDRGVNGNSSLFLVVQNVESLLPPPPADKKNPNPKAPEARFIAMIPVADYADFVANFGGSADDLVASLKLPNGQPAFSKVYKSYAIISSKKKLVEDYKPGLTRRALSQIIGEHGMQVLTQSDISVILKPQGLTENGYQQLVNLLKPAPKPQDENQPKPQAMQQTDEDASNSKLFANLYNTALLRVVKDSSNIVLGFGSNDKSMSVNVAMSFEPGSTMAGRLSGDAGPTTLIDRLPRRDYLYAFDSNFNNVDLGKMIEDLTTQLKEAGTWYAPLVEKAAPLFDQVQEIDHVFYAPQGTIGLGTRVMNSVMLLKVKDAQSFVSQFQQFLTNANGKSHPMGQLPKGETPETDSRPRVMVLSQFAANALADDRAQIAQFQLQYTMPMQVLAQMNDVARRMMVLGLNNQEGYIAAVNNDTVLLTTVTDAQLVKDTLTLLNQSVSTGLGKTQAIAAANENGVDTPSGQLHVNILSGMKATHMLVQLLLGEQNTDPVFPNQLMPLSVSYRTFSGALQARLHLPMQTIAYLRGDAMAVLAPLLPKPPVNPDDPNAQQPNERPNEPGMDPGMMDPGMGGMPRNPRRPQIPGR